MNEGKTPTRIEAVLPAPVLMLFHSPDAAGKSGGQIVDPSAREVASPKKRAWEWIYKVVDTSWRPSTNTEMAFLRKEFLDRDVVRIMWDRNGYHIEVAQTASIFTMKLVPQGAANMGSESESRLEFARQLCRQVFNREGRLWGQDAQGAGRAVAISGLSEKIVEYSFDITKMKQLSADKVVIGVAKSMKDEGVDSPAPREEPSGVVALNEKSKEAWHYWFRNVNWWNDGQAVGFYFLKVDGPGAWVPSFVGEIDKNWFHGPRDRLGRPLTVDTE
jgi:hypothetical protein